MLGPVLMRQVIVGRDTESLVGFCIDMGSLCHSGW